MEAMHHQARCDAYRVASHRASSTGRRHKLVSDEGWILDLEEP